MPQHGSIIYRVNLLRIQHFEASCAFWCWFKHVTFCLDRFLYLQLTTTFVLFILTSFIPECILLMSNHQSVLLWLDSLYEASLISVNRNCRRKTATQNTAKQKCNRDKAKGLLPQQNTVKQKRNCDKEYILSQLYQASQRSSCYLKALRKTSGNRMPQLLMNKKKNHKSSQKNPHERQTRLTACAGSLTSQNWTKAQLDQEKTDKTQEKGLRIHSQGSKAYNEV